MCKYCQSDTNDFVLLNEETSGLSEIEISINRQGMLRAQDFYEDELIDELIANIKYCPMCGRTF